MDLKNERQLEVLRSLKEKGFSEELIIKALNRCKSTKEEVVVDCIAEIMENPGLIEKEEEEKQRLLQQIEERKMEQLKDKEYLERVKQIIAENRKERPKIILDQAEEKKPAVVFGECTVKVRHNDNSLIFHLKKGDTVELLRNKIKEGFSITKFRMLIFHPSKELINDNETMEEVGLVPNGVVNVDEN